MAVKIIIICLLLTSCAPRYKFDTADKILMATALAGQVYDGTTAKDAMDRGAIERTPFIGEYASDKEILIIKAAGMGIIILGGWLLPPKPRKLFFSFATVLGFGAGWKNESANSD